jgi:hypothetical protein
VAVKFDLWDNHGEGRNSTGVFTRGAGPYKDGSINLTPHGINLHSGRTYKVDLTYDGGNLTLKISDVDDVKKTLTKTLPVDIPGVSGSPWAYVGFTGACGGEGAVQDILSWTWAQGDGP